MSFVCVLDVMLLDEFIYTERLVVALQLYIRFGGTKRFKIGLLQNIIFFEDITS